MKNRALAKTCPECGGKDLFETVGTIRAGGGYAPDLLPGLHGWLRGGNMRAVLCADCGLYRQFADGEARERLRTAGNGKWKPL